MKKPVFGFPTSSNTNRTVILRRWLGASNFGFKTYRDCSIYVLKTKALISCAVTEQLICDFNLAYAKSRLSHDVARQLGCSVVERQTLEIEVGVRNLPPPCCVLEQNTLLPESTGNTQEAVAPS